MKNIIKNKKADISITILVIGIFIVCMLAMLSFVMSIVSVRDSFIGIDLIEKMNSQVEEYGTKGNFGGLDISTNDQGVSVFYQEKKGNTGIIDKILGKKKILFSVEYPV